MMRVITFRPAAISDSDDLFEWRNDELTRAASISQELIPRRDHDRWFATSLASKSRVILVAEESEVGGSIGVCRFDAHDTVVEVSINLNPAYRGRGLASPVLRGAIAAYREINKTATLLTATIRPANVPSVRIFVAEGFVLERTDELFEYYSLDR